MQVLNSSLQQIYIHRVAVVHYNGHIIKIEFNYFSRFNTIYHLYYLTAKLNASYKIACNIQKIRYIKLSTNNHTKHVTSYNILYNN